MASDAEDSGAPESHPNKRVKTLTLGSPESSPSSSDKGKAKLELSDSEKEPNCCGICLIETGHGTTIIRGCIDCCDHYFCFVCIMEWSKVESRCPMCKRRFSTIRRPCKPPIFPSERVVNVPVRDQVFLQFFESCRSFALHRQRKNKIIIVDFNMCWDFFHWALHPQTSPSQMVSQLRFLHFDPTTTLFIYFFHDFIRPELQWKPQNTNPESVKFHIFGMAATVGDHNSK